MIETHSKISLYAQYAVLNGFRTIKMYGAEAAGVKYSDDSNYDYTQAEIKLAKRENLIMSSAFGLGL